jgi:DNA-binding CsgD family transcriptional regulator
MSATLPAKDLSQVLSYAVRTLAVERYDDVQPVLLQGLSRVVGCDAVTLTHLDLVSQHEVAVFWPPRRPDPHLLHRYAKVGHTHPLRPPLARLTAQRSRQPVRISDVMSSRAWRQTAIYHESHGGIADQMSVPLARSGSVVRAVTLSRFHGQFTERQRDVLHLSGEHLAHAVARARPDGFPALQIAPVVVPVPVQRAPGFAPRPADGAAGLSPREREVLELVAQGGTDAQVARQLGISPSTVSKHLHNVYERLGLPNRAAAVEFLLRQQPRGLPADC